MKILTLQTGTDFEQTSNTDLLEAMRTDELYFKPTPYPNEYGKIPNFIQWNYEKYTIKKSFLIHKTIFMEMKYDLNFDLKIEDIFQIEADINVIQMWFKSSDSSLKIKSISFIVNDEVINYYARDMVVSQYIGVREIFYTPERELKLDKQSDYDQMYFKISLTLKKHVTQFALMWVNYEANDLKVIVDIDETVIPFFTKNEITTIGKKRAWDYLNNVFKDEHFRFIEKYYNVNLLYMYRKYSMFKSMYFRMNEHYPDKSQVSVKSIDLEVAPVGKVVAELRKNRQDILNLGTLIRYSETFAHHYEFHPWFPGFSNYTTYNFTGYSDISTPPESLKFISFTDFNENSNYSALVEDSSSNSGTNINTIDGGDLVGGTIVYVPPTDSNINETPGSIGDDGNPVTVDAELSSDNFLNSLVIENIKFPWELLLSVFDYDNYTFDPAIHFDDYNFEYAILDQMDIVNGKFIILQRGNVVAGNYINFSSLQDIQYPVILYSITEHYYHSENQTRLSRERNEDYTTSIHFSNTLSIKKREQLRSNINFNYYLKRYSLIDYSQEPEVITVFSRNSSVIEFSSSYDNTGILHLNSELKFINKRNIGIPFLRKQVKQSIKFEHFV